MSVDEAENRLMQARRDWAAAHKSEVQPPPIKLSRLAATLSFLDAGIDLYFQNASGDVQFNAYLNGGLAGWQYVTPAYAVTGLAAVAWSDGKELRVYFQGTNGGIWEAAAEVVKAPQWNTTMLLTGALEHTGLAAVTWGSGSNICVYYQTENLGIWQASYNKGWSVAGLSTSASFKGTSLAAVN